jgi:hypothetical protein
LMDGNTNPNAKPVNKGPVVRSAKRDYPDKRGPEHGNVHIRQHAPGPCGCPQPFPEAPMRYC